MAVGSGVPYQAHIGNGVTRTFSYGFTLLDVADLVVTIDGVVTSSFTLTGLGQAAGGTITFAVAPANLAEVLFVRIIDLARAADYQENGDLLAETVNLDFDRLWLAVQQLGSSGGTGTLRAPFPEVLDELPPASQRLGLQLLFHPTTGQPFLAAPVSGTAADVLVQLADGTTAVDRGASLVAFRGPENAEPGSVAQRLGWEVYVTDPQFAGGADNTGATNCSTAVQAAIDYVRTFGGVLVFPPGKYLFTSQVTIDRTYAAVGPNFVGERNLIVRGYGAEIRTSGAISAFDVKGGWSPNQTCLIEGFTIYHRENTTAVAGIRMIAAGLVTCRDVSVAVSSSLPAGYAAFRLQNTDPLDSDTGCFWVTIDHCTIRPWAGGDGFCTYGVQAMGSSNALTLRNNTFSGANTHVILMAQSPGTASPNAVNIDGNHFEGPPTALAIRLDSSDAIYHVTGARITNNRFESVATAVSLTGIGTSVQLPLFMSGNYADTSLTNYVLNPLNIPMTMLDFVIVGAPMGPAKASNQEGWIFQNEDAAFDAVQVRVPNLGPGYSLRTAAGALLGFWRYRSFAGSAGTLLGGTSAGTYRPLGLVGFQGMSVVDTPANNLTGQATFAASTSVVVTFPVAEANSSYRVFLDNPANQVLWVTGKSTSGFTINSSVSNSTTVGWMIVKFA